ncbi:MAG: A24 family peptidase [Anaerolineae bacterium]|nr:A24 family peptidase [Anaerolineae bacterium]
MSTILYAMAGLLAGVLVNLGADVLPGGTPDSSPRAVRWGTPRPWRALAVELTMGGLFAYAWTRFGPSPQLWLISLYLILFALIFVIDLEHRLVLNRVVLAGAGVALAGSLLWGQPPLPQALLGGISGFALFLLIALIKPNGMGMGDVKLAGLIGMVMGFPDVLVALCIGVIAGGLGALVLLLSRRVRRGGYMPYAPFLVTGALVTLLQVVH